MSVNEFNLLSPQRRIRLAKLVKFLFVKELLEFIMFTCVLLATTHLVGWMILVSNLEELINSSLAVNKAAPPYNREIREMNILIQGVRASGKGYTPTTPLVIDLVASLPSDVRLESLDMDIAEKTLVLLGVAKTRNALLSYRELIAEIPWVEEVRAPNSQLFQKENINFEMSATIKQNREISNGMQL